LLEFAAAQRTPPDTAMLAARAHIEPPSGWQAITSGPGAAFSPAYRGADLASRSTWVRDGYVVQLDRLLYATQSQGKELIMYGNMIAPDSLRLRVLPAPTLRSSPLRPVATIVRAPGGPVLVWHWYRVAERVTTSPRRAKLLELPAMLTRNPIAELVAVSTRCHHPDCLDAADALLAFLHDSAIAAAPAAR
jgi:EpsI family protein